MLAASLSYRKFLRMPRMYLVGAVYLPLKPVISMNKKSKYNNKKFDVARSSKTN